MIKKFKFIYSDKKAKFGPKLEQNCIITVQTAREKDLGGMCAQAMSVFEKSVGNAKRFDVICIKELDEKGNQVGEDILPSGEAVVPIKKVD